MIVKIVTTPIICYIQIVYPSYKALESNLIHINVLRAVTISDNNRQNNRGTNREVKQVQMGGIVYKLQQSMKGG